MDDCLSCGVTEFSSHCQEWGHSEPHPEHLVWPPALGGTMSSQLWSESYGNSTYRVSPHTDCAWNGFLGVLLGSRYARVEPLNGSSCGALVGIG
jgi:hypothetical protein